MGKICKLLLRKGADPTIQSTKDGKTALELAEELGHSVAVEMLSEYG
jgi:ankyrin repeat protein